MPQAALTRAMIARRLRASAQQAVDTRVLIKAAARQGKDARIENGERGHVAANQSYDEAAHQPPRRAN